MRAAQSTPVLDGRARARFLPLRVRSVVEETTEARSFVLDVPPANRGTFAYRPGQFVNLRVAVGGEAHVRAYSMSSAPWVDPDLRITVKRVPGGVVSNWLVDNVRAGDLLDVSPPAGSFVVPNRAGDLVTHAAGSGITPVVSIVASELVGSDRRITLLYANRDRCSTIFARRLDELAARHPERFELLHHLDVEAGFVAPAMVAEVARRSPGAEHFICGPVGFMAAVEAGLDAAGIDAGRVHVERFTRVAEPVADPPGETEVSGGREVTIRLGGRTATVSHRPGTTVLQTARFAGLRAPSSCETGSCATCMARVVAGEARMRHNEALTPEEVAGGWVLTCQAEPVTPSVTVVYE